MMTEFQGPGLLKPMVNVVEGRADTSCRLMPSSCIYLALEFLCSVLSQLPIINLVFLNASSGKAHAFRDHSFPCDTLLQFTVKLQTVPFPAIM